jgi:hypothetical protein
MSRPISLPDRNIVARIIREEAAAHGVEPSAVSGASSHRAAHMARRRAVARILAETGCSRLGLSKVWGMSRQAAQNCAMGGDVRATYDARTAHQFRWLYPLRAEAILTGRDPNTNADVAAPGGRWGGPQA